MFERWHVWRLNAERSRGGIADSLTEGSTEVTCGQGLLTSDSNARSIGMTKAEKLQNLKGLREGCDSNDLWKSFLNQILQRGRISEDYHTGREVRPGGLSGSRRGHPSVSSVIRYGKWPQSQSRRFHPPAPALNGIVITVAARVFLISRNATCRVQRRLPVSDAAMRWRFILMPVLSDGISNRRMQMSGKQDRTSQQELS